MAAQLNWTIDDMPAGAFRTHRQRASHRMKRGQEQARAIMLELIASHDRERLFELAYEAGLHPSTVYFWVTGRTRAPHTSSLVAMADVMGKRLALIDARPRLVVRNV